MDSEVVLIGGAADGTRMTPTHHRFIIPVVGDPMRGRYHQEHYRVEEIAFGDGKPPCSIAVLEGMTVREAFARLVERYPTAGGGSRV